MTETLGAANIGIHASQQKEHVQYTPGSLARWTESSMVLAIANGIPIYLASEFWDGKQESTDWAYGGCSWVPSKIQRAARSLSTWTTIPQRPNHCHGPGHGFRVTSRGEILLSMLYFFLVGWLGHTRIKTSKWRSCYQIKFLCTSELYHHKKTLLCSA